MEPTSSSHKIVGIVIGAIVIIGAIGAAVFMGRKSTPAPALDTTPSVPVTTTLPPADTTKQTGSSVYKNGTYTATGSYMSPGGLDHVGVNLTLSDDLVTDITVTPEPGDNTSARYQAMFVSGIKALVVGKNIADLHIVKVSGSSLTGKGFNDAITQIEAQAKA